ncbi:MAG: thiolase family protein, partial [Pseudomonadota bacterium]
MSDDPIKHEPFAYIIAARRSALGRVGGLHAHRSLEELTQPVIAAVLDDAGLTASQVSEFVLGNATQSGNPARLTALCAGLPAKVPATTIDRQCASGLDAIIHAARLVCAGDAHVVIAGGADCSSTAPWRIAKPRRPHQLPHFLQQDGFGFETSRLAHNGDEATEPGVGAGAQSTEAADYLMADERLVAQLGISREQQDAWTVRAYLQADQAMDAKRFVDEIVPLRKNAAEARDEVALAMPEPDVLADLPAFFDPAGTLTPGNTSGLHDGAAFVAVVDGETWSALGRPPALRFVASAACGVALQESAMAPMRAMQRLYERTPAINPKDIGCFELSESSAAQAIAFAHELGIEDQLINRDGGA